MKKRVPIRFRLPDEVGTIAKAVEALRERYSGSELTFTPDGKFVGDLGEAIAVEMFGVELDQAKGIDGRVGKIPVQIKTTGRAKGGAHFREVDDMHPTNTQLIVYYIDWTNHIGELLFNGPESKVRPNCKGGQREASRHKLLSTFEDGADFFRLPIRDEFRERYIHR